MSSQLYCSTCLLPTYDHDVDDCPSNCAIGLRFSNLWWCLTVDMLCCFEFLNVSMRHEVWVFVTQCVMRRWQLNWFSTNFLVHIWPRWFLFFRNKKPCTSLRICSMTRYTNLSKYTCIFIQIMTISSFWGRAVIWWFPTKKKVGQKNMKSSLLCVLFYNLA